MICAIGANAPNDHKIPGKELTYSKGGDMVDLERLFILKYDDTPEDDIDEDYLF